MEAMDERNCEELSDVDLVSRKSKNGQTHAEFGGPIDWPGPEPETEPEPESKSNNEKVELNSRSASDEEEEQVIDERMNGEESKADLFRGSHTNGENNSDHIVPSSSHTQTHLNDLEISKTEITTIFSTSTSTTSHVDHGAALNGYSNVTVKPDESTILEEAKEDIPEFDVQKLLHKQETHDLFCPNCNSCITKRIILRRRKRKVEEISPSEENREEVIPEPVQIRSPSETERIEEYVEDTGRDAFRCVSCFSIFIPIGRGFKLFSFGGRGSKETARVAPLLITSDVSASVPVLVTGEEAGEEQRVVVASVQEQIPLNSQPEIMPEQGREKEDSMAVHADTNPQLSKVDSMPLQAAQTSPTKLDADGGNKLSDAYGTNGSVIAEKEVIEGQKEELQILIHESEAPAEPSILHSQKDVMGTEKITDVQEVTGKPNISAVNELDQTAVCVTLTTDNSPETEPLLPSENDTGTAPPVAATPGGDPQLDIVKSVVYGGLLESIASLSVVTSAAGANAKTLNVVALGAANMFGGLFILAHNLRVFKQGTSNERYEEVLGRPGHFTFHSTIAVVSYLMFGLMPPVIYGFTFRESDNREYKLIAVALVSLLCIILLSLGKAYARTHPRAYRKTIMYYVGLWVMVCGVSYAAGDLFDLVLQKLGLFESSSSAEIAVGEVRPLKTLWLSY